MSTTCEKSCSHEHEERKKLIKFIAASILLLIVIIGFTVLIVWAVLRPSNPRFVLQDTTISALNLTEPNILTSNFQVTIASRNSMDKVGIYYLKLDAYATYRNQQITLATELPSTYLGHRDDTVWSPFLYGNSVPLSPYLASALEQDMNAGILLLNIKIQGKLKWKVGSWMSGRYFINVNCPAYISFGDHSSGFAVGAGIKYQFVQGCHVDTSS